MRGTQYLYSGEDEKMIKEVTIWAVLLFVMITLANYLRRPEPASAQLPLETIQLVHGNRYRLQKGKPLVIHFWTTWCPACKLETDNIERLSKKYNVLTIAVNSGSDEKVKEYLKQRDLTFKVLNDREGVWAKKFSVEAFPVTFFYDSQGKLQFIEVGYTTTAGLLARMAFIE